MPRVSRCAGQDFFSFVAVRQGEAAVGPAVGLELDAGVAAGDHADVGEVAAGVFFDGVDFGGVVGRILALPVGPDLRGVRHVVGDFDVDEPGAGPMLAPPVGGVEAPEVLRQIGARWAAGGGVISWARPAPAMPIWPPGLTNWTR